MAMHNDSSSSEENETKLTPLVKKDRCLSASDAGGSDASASGLHQPRKGILKKRRVIGKKSYFWIMSAAHVKFLKLFSAGFDIARNLEEQKASFIVGDREHLIITQFYSQLQKIVSDFLQNYLCLDLFRSYYHCLRMAFPS